MSKNKTQQTKLSNSLSFVKSYTVREIKQRKEEKKQKWGRDTGGKRLDVPLL